MEYLSTSLPILIYFLLIVLLVVAIVLGIKLIFIMNKVDDIVDDIDDKVKTLDKVFNFIDSTSDRFSMLGDVVVSFLTSTAKKIFKPSKSKKNNEDKEDLDNE